jgi:hypothetical protein
MSDESGTKQQPEYNWSKTIEYNPTSYVAPMNLMALRQAVQDATQAGQQIRPRGTGHSWNEAISTSGCSINTCNMNPSNSSACVCKGKPPAERPCGGESCNDVVWGDVITVNGQPYQLLTVPPGINQGDLALLAQNKGCPLPTQGPAPDITISGFVANGCHGTGWVEPTIAELVYGIEFMGPGGETLYFSMDQVPPSLTHLGIAPADMMNIVRANLGALGVITKITFQLPVAPFNLNVGNDFVVMTDVFDQSDPGKLEALVLDNDYVEIFWFPYNNFKLNGIEPVPQGAQTDTLWVMTFNRTQHPVTVGEKAIVAWNDLFSELALLGGSLGGLVNLENGIVPAVSWFAIETMKAKVLFNDDAVFHPRDAFLYQTKYFRNFLDLEFTIPMNGSQGFKDVVDAFYQLVERMEAWRTGQSGNTEYPVNLNVHLRFVKNSQALMSPAYAPAGSSTHTCYIEYLSYSNGGLTQDYLDFNQDFYSAENGLGWKRYNGIPNWGKYLPSVPGIFPYIYGLLNPSSGPQPTRLQQFLQVRDCIDPNGVTFTNRYLASIFTGQDQGILAVSKAREEQRTAASPLPSPPPSRSFLAAPERHQALATMPAQRTHESGAILQLRHHPEAGAAYLVNEYAELNVFRYGVDPATQQVSYQLATPSQHLTPEQIFDRLGSFYGA